MTETPAAPGSPAGATGLSAADLEAMSGGTLLRRSPRPVRGAAVDSRLVEPGNLFVALRGERTDGHRFLGQAVARGAAALLVAHAPDDSDDLGDVTVLQVADPLPALQAIAGAWRARFDPLVVGITGSVAKTSTKEATAAVLAARFTTLRSEGNQNNEIGLPLTLLRLGPEHRAAVLEMGMYVGGEIAVLAAIGRPSIGVVTAIAPVHLERAGSMEAIVAAKAELLEALPADGTAVLNGDDPLVAAMAARTQADVLTYGLDPAADIRAEALRAGGASGMSFELVARRPRPARFAVGISALGRHSVVNALAAAAVGLVAGLADEEIATGLGAPWGSAAGRRSRLVRAGGITILDDTYNASPPSMRAALELLGSLGGRPVAVLGEMLELGPLHEPAHREVGACAAGIVAELVVVGPGAAGIADGAEAAGLAPARVHRVADREAALAVLRARSWATATRCW
ncbi:MAG: UDP-N-acetylmuramoyl-tripeptide--D-alanyl-D-alanine ligase [Chloroflexi bacterium]|nr:UDP-N-acetylmuramoyl-tripeptide--D-alanyl-D-alanine ligase [Chloroflexota bacterium]